MLTNDLAAAPDAASSARTVATRATWIVLLVLLTVVSARAYTEEFVDLRLRGDQASHVFQAITLAEGVPDLTFDERDFAAWQEMGWTPGPDGLIVHRDGDDLTAGKPYGYSLLASPFVRVLGPVRGMTTANVVLFLANVAIIGWLLARRLRGAVLPLAIGAFALASTLYLNLWIMQPELFMAALVGVVCVAAIEGVRRDNAIVLAVGFVASAFLVTERLPVLVLVAPILAWTLFTDTGRRRRWPLLGLGAATLLLAVIPYLQTTSGESFTAYGGDRAYFVPGTDSWPPDPALVVSANGASKFFSVDHVAGQLHPDNWGDIGRATIYTLIGRNTGMLLFLPMALLAVLVVLWTRPWRTPTSQLNSILFGVIAYGAFHVVLITDTFWGGGQTLGNKYLLQILPAYAALLALAEVRHRVVAVASALAITLAIAGLGPKLWEPEESLWAVWQNTALQDALPYEYFALDPAIYPPQGDG